MKRGARTAYLIAAGGQVMGSTSLPPLDTAVAAQAMSDRIRGPVAIVHASNEATALRIYWRRMGGSRAPTHTNKATRARSRRRRKPNPIPRGIDRRSVRTVKRGRSRVLVGCPTGHWHPRAKGRKCDVAMRALEVKRNPAAALAQGARTFRKWHDFDPRTIKHVSGPRAIPRTLVLLGSIPLFTYVSDKWEGRPRTYEHRTKRPHPLLCTGPDGRGLFIVGGRTRVTARGLVD